MKALINVFIFETKLLFRRKNTLVYTFFMPLMLLFVFGIAGKDFPEYSLFIIPGLIGLVALSHSIQSIAPTIGGYKLMGIWKRIKSSPLKVWKYAVGLIASRFILIISGSVFIMLIGFWGYNFEIRGNILLLFLFLSFGILSFMSIGLFVSSLFKSVESISVTTGLIVYPMLFLSNAFWPLSYFPKPLQVISRGLPLTQMVNFSRAVVYGNQIKPADMIEGIAIIVAWFIVCFTLGVTRFVRATEG